MFGPVSIDIPAIAKLAPPTWESLLDFTNRAIGGPEDPSLDVDAVARVYEHVQTLSDAETEEAYYFGLRPIMSGIDALVQNPAAHEQAVEQAANGAYTRWKVTSHNDKRHSYFRVGDLQPSGNTPVLLPIAVAANKLVPTDWRVLADVLTLSIDKRRVMHQERRGLNMQHDPAYAPQEQFGDVLLGHPTTYRAAENGLSGSFSLVRKALHELYKHGGGKVKMVDDRLAVPLTKAIRYASELDEQFGMVAKRCATFRIDQFPSVIERCIVVSKDGKPAFDATHQKAIKQQPRPPKVARLSDPTYRCPAVFAGDLIPNMVGIAIEATGVIHDRLDPSEKTPPGIVQFLVRLIRKLA
jgi:hypothetical protein